MKKELKFKATEKVLINAFEEEVRTLLYNHFTDVDYSGVMQNFIQQENYNYVEVLRLIQSFKDACKVYKLQELIIDNEYVVEQVTESTRWKNIMKKEQERVEKEKEGNIGLNNYKEWAPVVLKRIMDKHTELDNTVTSYEALAEDLCADISCSGMVLKAATCVDQDLGAQERLIEWEGHFGDMSHWTDCESMCGMGHQCIWKRFINEGFEILHKVVADEIIEELRRGK